ncbi:hypothetical protein Y1Q_0016206 [Alligator mississippiensis]|uniref:SCAN box domain-containing protein n=1 Tax=Alligator mississippiensis TaxID=8496 RepID=A0A151P165_ALLMI|nr:hypothetical protein Y1Q_0016206 [Alligator mississippiensis]
MTRLDKGYWARQLGTLIVGKVQADEAWDYERVKAATLYKLKINPEHYRKLFRDKKGPDERWPRILLQLLQDLLNKWASLAVYDRDALEDQILLDQFQKDLEELTQHWVR